MAAYVALVRKEPGSDYGVSFPDFPGCVTAGRTLEEAYAMAEEALAGHVELLLEDNDELPPPSSPEAIARRRDTKGALLALVPLGLPRRKAVRVDITMNPRLLNRIDRAASLSGVSRSRFLEVAARRALGGEADVGERRRRS